MNDSMTIFGQSFCDPIDHRLHDLNMVARMLPYARSDDEPAMNELMILEIASYAPVNINDLLCPGNENGNEKNLDFLRVKKIRKLF